MAGKILGKFRHKLGVATLKMPVKLDHEQTRNLRSAQLSAVTDLASVLNLASLLNVAVLVVTFRDTGLVRSITAWGSLMFLVHAYVIFANQRLREKDLSEVLNRTLQGFIRGATIIGVLWALVPLMVFPFGDSIGVTAVSMLLMGMMFGAVLLVGRIPQAAMGLVCPIVVGILVGLQFQQDPRTDLLVVLILASAGLLYFASRLAYVQFAQQFLGQSALEEQAEVIGLLLRDFEETTSDWLWEIDAKGRFVPLPTELGGSSSGSELIVEGQSFEKLIHSAQRCDEIQSAFRERRPFKDMVIKVGSKPDIWWSVTGKPLFSKGVFEGYRGVASDITQSKQIEDRMTFMAHYDMLTGLPNRSSLTDKLESLSSRAAEWSGDLALAWLDLDNFKWVNDTLGHQAGDEVLRSVGARLKAFADDETMIARISGDEFALILPADDHVALKEMMNRLCAVMAEPHSIWGTSVMCRASVGVRIIMRAGFNVNKALKHADLALYKAKQHQKGSWAVYDQALEEKARAMRELEVDLNNAIENNELLIYFQPIVNANTQDVEACECLLRWKHPTKGLLSPDAFIEFAEDSGVITRLGDWVLRQALSEARRLPEHVRIAVNISPMQIHSASLVPTIVNALATNGIDPGRLELEITESVMISDTEFTMQRLKQLKELGLRIALDDFGTGFSSLSYLRQFPFDKLKIDKSFTKDLETNEDSRAITRATLQLAKALGMRCTGEGVETPGQGDFLREQGCNELQGFIISRPKPLDELAHLIDLQPVEGLVQDESVVVLKQPKPSLDTAQATLNSAQKA